MTDTVLKDMVDHILRDADAIGVKQRECSRRQGRKVRDDFRNMVADFAKTLI